VTRWLVIADDLTGACDTGAVFAQAGLRTRVLLAAGAAPEAATDSDVLVVTTESRHLPAHAAAAAVARAAALHWPGAAARVYKKIDSTLRGQPGPELGALMRVLGLERALVAPAFPGQGRIVRGGQVLVNGVRLEESVFGAQAGPGSLVERFAGSGALFSLGLADTRRGAEWLAGQMEGPGVWLADAEDNGDLGALAAAARLSGARLLCGSAGLARAAAQQEEGGAAARRPVQPGAGSPVLVAAGSRHPATLAQVAAAGQAGLALFRPGADDLRIANRVSEYAAELARNLRAGRSLVLSVDGLAFNPGDEARVAVEIANLAGEALAQVKHVGGLVLTGGETAAAVCRALDCRVIDLGGEIQPGLGWGWLCGGRRPGLAVATKAGGFGDAGALAAAARFLAACESCET